MDGILTYGRRNGDEERWYVYLGVEKVPMGCFVEVRTKQGNIGRVKIARVLQDSDGHWFGDWRLK